MTMTADLASSPTTSSPRRVGIGDVLARLNAGTPPTLVDVRTPAEYETAHVAGSYNVPVAMFSEHAAELGRRLPADTVLLCQSGARAEQARQRLVAAGAGSAQVQVLDGGVDALERAGAGVVRGRQRWAMDRQVRLGAGSLVVASIAVSVAVPAVRFAAAVPGVGLMVSALTGVCPMARALSWLPYNRGPVARSASQVISALPAAQS